MDENNKKLIGYKPELIYIDDYSSELNKEENYDIDLLPSEEDNEIIDDLMENIEEINTIIDMLPEPIKDKVQDVYDQIYDFIKEELKDKVASKVPSREEWIYNDKDTDFDWDNVDDKDLTMDEFNPDAGWDDDDDLFPITKEEHTEEEIANKEYIKNLTDLFEDYVSNLKNIISNYWANFLIACANKDSSEIKMLLNNILLSSSNILDNSKHLLDAAVREAITKDIKLNYFSTIFNAEETIKHLKQLKAMQELRLRYLKIPEVIGNTKTNQMNNNILEASRIIYDRKYEIAYENLYRYLTSSNKILDDTLQTNIHEMKSKQILIERKGIK